MLLLVLLVVLVVIPIAVVALSVRSMSRANRVTPRVPTFAPTSWLFLPERPARLHRRLRRSAAMARSGAAIHAGGSGRGLATIPELADEIERRACTIDTQVVLASRGRGPQRWSMLNALEGEVNEVEALATRLVNLTTTWATVAATGQQQPGGTQALAERLDALENAVHEVEQLSTGQHPAWGPHAVAAQAEGIDAAQRPSATVRRLDGRGRKRII